MLLPVIVRLTPYLQGPGRYSKVTHPTILFLYTQIAKIVSGLELLYRGKPMRGIQKK